MPCILYFIWCTACPAFLSEPWTCNWLIFLRASQVSSSQDIRLPAPLSCARYKAPTSKGVQKFAIASLGHLLAPRYRLGPWVIEIIPRRATAGTGGQGVSHFRAHEGCKWVLGLLLFLVWALRHKDVGLEGVCQKPCPTS